MIANYEHLSELPHAPELVLCVHLGLEEVPNRDQTFEAEVHLRNFILLIIDNFIVGVHLWIEKSWQEAVRNIIQELLLSRRILGGLEEEFEVFEDVLEQIICHKLPLHGLGQFIQSVRVLVNRSQSVVSPEVVEMLRNLVVKRFW